jgi:anti-sigma B factor antagonist
MLPGANMELTPTDSQGAGRRQPAVGDEERRFEGTPRVPRRRFSFDFSRMPRATVITLAGELDVVCADSFKRRFAEATEDEPAHVVLDVRELTFMDSTGLALLLGVNEMSQDAGFALWVVATEDDPCSRIFRITGANRILPLADELPEFG